MIQFLIRRPIAVLMTFTAFFVLGIITYYNVPTSLLPDISIPEVTVKVTGNQLSAREIENSLIRPLRQELLQVTGINNIESQSKDEEGLIRLFFDYGINTDLATIEVNEKIDAAMNRLPRETPRPLVIKSRVTDIPVFNLCITLREDSIFEKTNIGRFMELSEFATMVIKRRIEQLSQVAMVDLTGTIEEKVEITIDRNKMELMGMSQNELETILNNHSVNPGGIRVRDGFYEYEIRFSNAVRSIEDIENILINHEGRILRLKEIAQVKLSPQEERGFAFANGKQAVVMSVIKHNRENMEDMKKALNGLLDVFQKEYPEIQFSITQNQTELLDYTISNLKQNLLLGFLLICIVSILFLGDFRSPIVICGTMVVSLIICFLFFYIFKISLNIISISGLILALGMMIDSSIIVTDNISQYRNQGIGLEESCILGTKEVITPMLSSTFTTIAVFIPLIFMSGIAGALFFDQAFSVTVGLLISYICGICLLPVLYKLAYSIPIHNAFQNKMDEAFSRFNKSLVNLYDQGIDWVFRHKTITLIISFSFFAMCYLLFLFIPKTKMPALDYVESIIEIDWNEHIHLHENEKRTFELLKTIRPNLTEFSGYIGKQQFVLNRQSERGSSETELYIKVVDIETLRKVEASIDDYINHHYPSSTHSFSPPPTVFERIFRTGEDHLVAELYPDNRSEYTLSDVQTIKKTIEQQCESSFSPIQTSNQINIQIDPLALLQYHVAQGEIMKALRTAFKDNKINDLHSNTQSLPIYISGKEETLNQMLASTLISTQKGDKVPLRNFIKISHTQDFKVLKGGKQGQYTPLVIQNKNEQSAIQNIKQAVSQTPNWSVEFSGGYFSNEQILQELLTVLLVSLLMMYFILAAQFESFLQPLIVLFEIPIDIAAALAILYLFGHSLNLMSAIGIIVTCGIIINDSILKLDMINELRKQGYPIIDAIQTAGHRRLRSILMTSITTILAMVPLLFASDMGSELQKPLAIATIGGMAVGTLVSLFIIPLVYWLIHKNNKEA